MHQFSEMMQVQIIAHNDVLPGMSIAHYKQPYSLSVERVSIHLINSVNLGGGWLSYRQYVI